MKIIDGLHIANELQLKLQIELTKLREIYNIIPSLRVILVGNNPASEIYVKNKQKKAEKIGIDAKTINVNNDIAENELIKLITQLNNDQSVNGILVQLPLPSHINSEKIINLIDVNKDVDGFNIKNVGNLIVNKNALFKPCTPSGCLYLIKKVLGENLSGLDAVIVGRSNIVGKPMASLLLHENCTVTITHSKTRDIKSKTNKADILVAAVGIPNLITKDWIKTGSTIIDVGINRINNQIVGDVDFESVKETVGFITPVPKGVGPMTITFLLINTLIASCIQNDIDYLPVLSTFI
jgi:methylenetetrahydrofolate dehydrogenase (NADP+)/methenyltetrahydrofolate cyclohydrolase